MLETGSKIVASFVVVLYTCGFLITSIHNFQYGYSEMNPFRPRILTAGAWFFVFLALPFTFVRRLTRTPAFQNSEKKGIMRFLDISWVYLASCEGISIGCSYIFSFDEAGKSASTPAQFGIVALVVFGVLVLIVLGVFLFHRLIQKWRNIVVATFVAVLIGSIVYQGINDFVNKRQFHWGAVGVWFAATGLFFYYELDRRSWLLSLGDWPPTMIAFLGFLAFFAENYYPHILSSWGGGMPIPVTITFTKDAAKNALQDIPYKLLDETDAGLYVLPFNEGTATFVPRSAIGMVQFSIHDASKK